VLVAPTVEIAKQEDIEELAALRLAQGWHKSRPLLEALRTWDRGRIFVIRDAEAPADGAPHRHGIVASTAAIACDGVGVIGNVMVRADQQRKGLGRRVMVAALDWLRERGVRSVVLDATPAGRPLYRTLGFVPYGLSYFADAPLSDLDDAALDAAAGEQRASICPASELGRLAALDRAAFGGDRLGLLASLLHDPAASLVVADGADGQPAAYALVRPQEAPNLGVRLGPWVARDQRAAAAVLRAGLAPNAPWCAAEGGASAERLALHVGLPGTSTDALDLLRSLGLRIVEDDLMMQFDFVPEGAAPPATAAELRPIAEHPEWVYGWLAPMVF